MALALGVTGGHAAAADTFTADYTPLADSPLTGATTWYSGAVTRDGSFVYGIGNSHNAYGDNGVWLYDPATDTHRTLFPNTGEKWKWTPGAGESGHWAALDPSRDRALYEFFGGPTVRALTNRNNHQAFYMPARNEFWVLAGTTFYQSSPYFGGRFSLDTNRWAYLSKPWGEKTVSDLEDFSAGLIAGSGGWVPPNAVTAVCPDIDTVVLFGGMSGRGGMRIIEPNEKGPEPYKWGSAATPPFHHPVENARHNAACVGDTVYFIEGQRRVPGVKCCSTPDPAEFWKFHVGTRTWTKLTSGPPGGYFGVLTHDAAAKALLLYGGSASAKLWAYDLLDGTWHNLTGTASRLPRADMHTGGYVPGFGHVYKGGKRYDATTGASMGYGASAQMMKIALRRVRDSGVPAALSPPPPSPPQAAKASGTPATTAQDRTRSIVQRVVEKRLSAEAPSLASLDKAGVDPAGKKGATAATEPKDAQRVRARPPASSPASVPSTKAAQGAVAASSAASPISGGAIRWTKIPLPGWPNSPERSMKHQRLVEGPGGRVYLLGGDWGGGRERHTGRQEVFSFDPLSSDGDWRQEAPYCGTHEKPVHWHTDEAGVAWDAGRRVFWKVAGTPYGPKDDCLKSGRSVKAKVITFDPTTRAWVVPPGFDQKNLGYVTNGVMDPEKDEMVQITNTHAWHLSLQSGQWSSHVLPGNVMRFNAIAARVDRTVWWLNRNEQLESYGLDTHETSGHGLWPFGRQPGWATAMTLPHGARVLLVWPTSRSSQPKLAALFDPATKIWTTLDMGAARGNTAMMHSSGRVVLMGGMAPPEDHNKFVWVGTLP